MVLGAGLLGCQGSGAAGEQPSSGDTGVDDSATGQGDNAVTDDSESGTNSDDWGPAESSGGDPTVGDGDSTTDDGQAEDGGTDTGDPPRPGEVELEGYGTQSTFGEGGDVCVVTTLADSGPGSFRDCVVNRDTEDGNPTARVVTFDVGGEIVPLSDIRVRQPFLTIDGLSAPDPGITIAKAGDGTDGEFAINTWPANNTCGHDVLVQGIRFRGVWTRDTEAHSQNAATIAIDGEDLALCLRNVVLNRITVIDAQDSGGDIWGSAADVTVQYSAFLYSLHPNTYSHAPGGVADQQRERISNHHNLYAYIHERGPQIRGDIRDSNFEQNIMHSWSAFGFGGGYAFRVRCRDGSCPSGINARLNHFTAGGSDESTGLVLGEQVGNGGDEPMIAPELFMEGNWLPDANVDEGAAVAQFPRSPGAEITTVAPEDLVDQVVPHIGVPYRVAEESAVFDEVAVQIATDLG